MPPTAPCPALTDLQAIAGVAAGDAAALRLLYDRYGRYAWALVSTVVDDHAAADDIVQDTFLSVWTNAAQFDPTRSANVRGWILSIAHHRALDVARKHLRQRSTSADLELIPDDDDPLAGVDAGDLRACVRTALAALPADQRLPIELNVIHRMSHREIADQHGLPVGTVKARIRLGMKKLAASLHHHRTEVS